MAIAPCPDCGARVLRRGDGSCPACGPARAAVAMETGASALHLLPKASVLGTGPPSMPDRCACCGAASQRRVEVKPIAGSGDALQVPSCEDCVQHLAPVRRRAAALVAVTACAIALVAASATGWSAGADVVLAIVAVATIAAIVRARRAEGAYRAWTEPREGHAGSVEMVRVLGAFVLRSQHRSWIRDVEELNRGRFDAKLELDAADRSRPT